MSFLKGTASVAWVISLNRLWLLGNCCARYDDIFCIIIMAIHEYIEDLWCSLCSIMFFFIYKGFDILVVSATYFCCCLHNEDTVLVMQELISHSCIKRYSIICSYDRKSLMLNDASIFLINYRSVNRNRVTAA